MLEICYAFVTKVKSPLNLSQLIKRCGNNHVYFVMMLTLLSGCSSNNGFVKLPISVPYHLNSEHYQQEIKFIVTKETKYSFSLRFKFPLKNQNERDKLQILMGDFPANEFEQKSMGVPLLLSLSLVNVDDGDNQIVSKNTQYVPIYSIGENSFNKELLRTTLAPGKYKIVVTNTQSMNALAGFQVDLTVSQAHLGK